MNIPGGYEKRLDSSLDRERATWRQLAKQPAPAGSPQRKDHIGSWLDAHREYRDRLSELTAFTIHSTRQILRDSAALLLGAPNRPRTAIPSVGQRFKDRDGVTWEVTAVVQDLFESDFHLLQLTRSDDPGGDPADVFSDDWLVFCLVRGLRPCAER